MSEQGPSPNENPLVREALMCLKFGFFDGALARARRKETAGAGMRDAGQHIAWFAGVYLGGSSQPSPEQTKAVRPKLKALSGGQGIAEGALYAAAVGRLDAAALGIRETLRFALAQHGVLVTWHPVALLRLAEIALRQLDDVASARQLVNCALGFRTVYVVLDDVNRLAELLVALKAPTALWVEWGAILLRHIQFAAMRPRWFEQELHDPHAVHWASEQDAASEQVLRQAIQSAPPELIPILVKLSPHLDVATFADVVSKRYHAPKRHTASASSQPSWFDPDDLRLRYFWYDMLTPSEQDFVRNGDWAMFYMPTIDFSMGVAQWWRTLESVLKRGIAGTLSKLFTEHAEWVEMDRASLSKKDQEKESIFVDKLANPKKAARLTLGDLVLVLQKCVSDAGSKSGTRSRLRTEAARVLGGYRDQLQPLLQSKWLNPVHLTIENVDWFRNRASHDEPLRFVDAAVGRFLSKRVLDVFFQTVLDNRGFKLVIHCGPS